MAAKAGDKIYGRQWLWMVWLQSALQETALYTVTSSCLFTGTQNSNLTKHKTNPQSVKNTVTGSPSGVPKYQTAFTREIGHKMCVPVCVLHIFVCYIIKGYIRGVH